MRIALAAFALMALAAQSGSAAAQNENPAPPQEAPTPQPDQAEQSGRAALERAQAMISASAAEDLFVAEADPKGEPLHRFPRVRHLRSGLVCVFNTEFGGEITIYPNPTVERGDDVGCTIPTMFDSQNVYATRVLSSNVDQEFDGAVGAVRRRFRNLREFTPTRPRMMPALPQPDVDRRRASFVNDQLFTHVSVAIIGGWVIKLRLSGPAGAAELLDERADMAWRQLARAALEAQAANAP